MSSFRKISDKNGSGDSKNRKAKVPGVKPWVHGGLSLVSFGHRELDELIGGGHVLGTVVLIEADNFSNHASTIMNYELAEAISMQHNVVLISPRSNHATELIQSLPHNMNADSKTESSASSSSSSDESRVESSKQSLQIAWQYQKYIKKGLNTFKNTYTL